MTIPLQGQFAGLNPSGPGDPAAAMGGECRRRSVASELPVVVRRRRGQVLMSQVEQLRLATRAGNLVVGDLEHDWHRGRSFYRILATGTLTLCGDAGRHPEVGPRVHVQYGRVADCLTCVHATSYDEITAHGPLRPTQPTTRPLDELQPWGVSWLRRAPYPDAFVQETTPRYRRAIRPPILVRIL